jgi:hypothetical protein
MKPKYKRYFQQKLAEEAAEKAAKELEAKRLA